MVFKEGFETHGILRRLVRVLHQYFRILVPWDATLFGVDNGGIPLYITMQDVFEIIHGNQILNMTVIQLWIIVSTLNNYMLFNRMMFHESCH